MCRGRVMRQDEVSNKTEGAEGKRKKKEGMEDGKRHAEDSGFRGQVWVDDGRRSRRTGFPVFGRLTKMDGALRGRAGMRT